MAHTPLSKIHLPLKTVLLPIYANLLGLRRGGIQKTWLFYRIHSDGVANTAVQSFLPRRLRPRTRKGTQKSEEQRVR